MNTPPPLPGNAMQRQVWWIMWLAFMSGLPAYITFLPGSSSHPNLPLPDPIAIPMMAVPLLASGVLRWVLIPRVETRFVAFKMFIIGIAFAEAVCFFGIFLFPQYRIQAFILSLLGVLQFMPIFINRFYEPPKR